MTDGRDSGGARDSGSPSGDEPPTSHEDVLRSGRNHEVDDESRRQAMRLPVDPDEPKDDMGLGTIDDPEPIKSVIPELTPIIVDVPDTPPPSDSPDPSPAGARNKNGEPTEIAPPADPDLLPQPWWRTSKPLRWAAVGVVAVVVVAGGAKLASDGQTTEIPGTEAAATVVDEPLPGLEVVAEENADSEPEASTPADEPQDTASQSSSSVSMSESEEDPTGDMEPAFEDLDAIDGERSVNGVSGDDVIIVTDIVRLDVVSDAAVEETRIVVAFNGNARDIATEETGTLKSIGHGIDVLIRPPEGRVLNVLYRSDGKIKISDIPPGMSITSEWVTPDELLIIIAGLALTPGTQVEAFLLVEAYGGFMADVVSLLMASS